MKNNELFWSVVMLIILGSFLLLCYNSCKYEMNYDNVIVEVAE